MQAATASAVGCWRGCLSLIFVSLFPALQGVKCGHLWFLPAYLWLLPAYLCYCLSTCGYDLAASAQPASNPGPNPKEPGSAVPVNSFLPMVAAMHLATGVVNPALMQVVNCSGNKVILSKISLKDHCSSGGKVMLSGLFLQFEDHSGG